LSYYPSLTITLPPQVQRHLFLPPSSHNRPSLGPLPFSRRILYSDPRSKNDQKPPRKSSSLVLVLFSLRVTY
ncbi:hypothetical protein BDR03DRAFT_967297, partial [Suillus americanus]